MPLPRSRLFIACMSWAKSSGTGSKLSSMSSSVIVGSALRTPMWRTPMQSFIVAIISTIVVRSAKAV